jgi:alcohol dehydrogenase class IV
MNVLDGLKRGYSVNIETFFNGDDAKRFFFPGRVFIGKGMAAKAAEVVAEYDSVAVVVDRAFAESDLYVAVMGAVAPGKAMTWVVQGAPFAQDIAAFIAQMKETPEVVVSIGGGSAADFAKAIILQELFGSIDGIGVGDKRGLAPQAGSRRPVYVAIPTTAGSGAEASRYYVTYDKVTHGKIYGKTWTVVADWIFLDPEVLSTMPIPALVGCAFDAFVHFFETLVAKHERSAFGEMFSLDGIPRIMAALDAIVTKGRRDGQAHEELLYAATLAGMAISNVRTGHIHEAAGALLEYTDLSHAETLFVFFRDAIEQYVDAIRDHEEQLISHLRLKPSFADLASIEDVISWWEKMFDQIGITKRIRRELKQCRAPEGVLREHIFRRVFDDKVWVTKECPCALDENAVRVFIGRSLGRFGISE